MDELNKIIDRYTDGNYLIGKTAKEEMAKDILALFNVTGMFKSVYEETPPINCELLVKSTEGRYYLSRWREAYSVFDCQCKGEASSDWMWIKI